jgi:hypothetical protein
MRPGEGPSGVLAVSTGNRPPSIGTGWILLALVVSLSASGAPLAASSGHSPAGPLLASEERSLPLVSLGNWMGFQGAGNLSGWAPGPGPTNGTILWKTYVGSCPNPGNSEAPALAPVVVGETVIVPTGTSGDLLALNESTGSLIWSRPLGQPLCLSPVSDGKRVYVRTGLPGASGGNLSAVWVSNGSLDWIASPQAGGPTETPPNLVQGVVVVSNSSGALLGYNSTTGHEVYRVLLPGNAIGGISLGPASEPIAVVVENSSKGQTEVSAYNATAGFGPGWGPVPLPGPAAAGSVQTEVPWPAGSATSSVSVPTAFVADGTGGAGSRPSIYAFTVQSVNAGGVTIPAGLSANWTGPTSGEGFDGPAGVIAANASGADIAWVCSNGSLDIFTYQLNASGHGFLSLDRSLPLVTGPAAPEGSAPATAGHLVITADKTGNVSAWELPGLQRLWTANVGGSIQDSLAISGSLVFALTSDGLLYAVGELPGTPVGGRLIVQATANPWIGSNNSTQVTITVNTVSEAGLLSPAPNATVGGQASLGSLEGLPGRTGPNGLLNATFAAPSVSLPINVSLRFSATWGSLLNGTVVVITVLPGRLVHSTPLSLLPVSLLPPSLGPQEIVPLVFLVTEGPGGPPVPNVTVNFEAVGGTVTPSQVLSGRTGQVYANFTAARTSGVSAVEVQSVASALGYPSGSYSWQAVVSSIPAIDPQVSPDPLVVKAGETISFVIHVNSTAGSPIVSALVNLAKPALGGNLSVLGGLTDATGSLTVRYQAPRSVSPPAGIGEIPVTVSASGYPTLSFEVPVMVIANVSSSPGSPGGPWGPLGTLTPGEQVGLLVGVGTGGGLLGFLARRRRPRVPPPEVWASASEEGPEEELVPWEGPPDPDSDSP